MNLLTVGAVAVGGSALNPSLERLCNALRTAAVCARRLMGLLVLLFAGNANAGWDTAYRTITSIYPHDGGITFNVDGAVIMPAAPCVNRFILGASTPNYAAKVATLLSMHAQGRRIQIYYDSASTACDVPVSAFISEP